MNILSVLATAFQIACIVLAITDSNWAAVCGWGLALFYNVVIMVTQAYEKY